VTQFLLVYLLSLQAGPLTAPSSDTVHPDFFAALGLATKPENSDDVWRVTDKPPTFAWMIDSGSTSNGATSPIGSSGNSFQQLLNRVAPTDDHSRSTALPGVIVDPGRWFYKQEREGDFYTRKTKLEIPNANEVLLPYASRSWKAQDKVQIPVPVSVPLAEQLFVYGQLDGSGDALSKSSQTSLFTKSGVGVKWTLIAGSELQLRYATLLSYSDSINPGRFLERAQPAVEVNAKMPLFGPLEIEYTGSALPAVSRLDSDSFKHEVRLAVPLNGDNEFEFGARYRWDMTQETTPWVDRAELFIGLKFRH
jgi:hypothetical protein